jgi:hypothetical protein
MCQTLLTLRYSAGKKEKRKKKESLTLWNLHSKGVKQTIKKYSEGTKNMIWLIVIITVGKNNSGKGTASVWRGRKELV